MTFDDFVKCEIRIGTVRIAEPVEGSEKLLRLGLDIGEKDEAGNPILRQIVSGIAKFYTPESLIDVQVAFVANLDPRMLMGLESRGMILAAHGESGEAIVLSPRGLVPPGSHVS